MNNNNTEFGLSMKEAWKAYFMGKDVTNYLEYEAHHSMIDSRRRLYKINYIACVIILVFALFFNFARELFIFSFVWYKPVCHAIHLKRRVNRYNIELFAKMKGLK